MTENIKEYFEKIKNLWEKISIELNKDVKCFKSFNDLKERLENIINLDDKKLLDYYKNNTEKISKENIKNMFYFSVILGSSFELTSIPTIIHEYSHFLVLSAYYRDPSINMEFHSPFKNAEPVAQVNVDLKKIPLTGDEWNKAIFSMALAPYATNILLMGFFYILYRKNQNPLSKLMLLSFMMGFMQENLFATISNQFIFGMVHDFFLTSKVSDFTPNQISMAVLISTVSVYAALKLYYDKKENKESAQMLRTFKEVGGSKVVHDNLKNFDNLFISISKDSKKIIDLISEVNAELYSSKLSEYVIIGKESIPIDNKLKVVNVSKFFTLDEVRLFEYDKPIKEVLKSLIKLANLLYKTKIKNVKDDESKINNVLRLCQEFYLSDYWLNYENGAVKLWNTINKDPRMYDNEVIVED